MHTFLSIKNYTFKPLTLSALPLSEISNIINQPWSIVTGDLCIVKGIANSMSVEQRTIMRNIARISKSRTNIFHETQLSRRKQCSSLDVHAQMKGLVNLGLIKHKGKGLWQTTPLGRKVEHFLEIEYHLKKYPFSVIRLAFF